MVYTNWPIWGRFFIAILALSQLFGCGSYSSENIDLTDDQLEAIRSKLSTECTTNNASIFTALLAKFTTSINTKTVMENYAYYVVTYNNNGQNTTFKMGIYKIYDNTIYFITEGSSVNSSDSEDRVYKFTLADQNKFFSESGNLTSTICTSPNTFNNVVNDFYYTLKSFDPNGTDDNRIEHVIKYKNDSNIPLFFSVFNYEYTRTEYENGGAGTPVKRSFTMKKETLTDTIRLDLFKETRFDGADHCIFSATANWAATSSEGVDFTTLATCTESSSSTGRFSWTDVNPSTN